MPTRLIREGLLDSEAVLSLPVDARWVYVSILLTADDIGLFEATPFRIARKADIRRELADTMVQLLVDRDLIRLYQVDGRQYGFIPRYGQRVQIRRAKYPLPPMELLQGDTDAIKKINNLTSNPTVDHGDPTVDNGKTPPEAEAEAKKELSVASLPRRRRAPTVPATPYEVIAQVHAELLPELPQVASLGDKRKREIRSFWEWVMTSCRSDGTRRAETAEQGLDFVRKYFARVRHNDWLMGRSKRAGDHENWEPTIEFLLSERGRIHVIEKTKVPA